MASLQQGMLRTDEKPAKQMASVYFNDSPPSGGEFFFVNFSPGFPFFGCERPGLSGR
ncbi:MAG: hypothetical protein V3S64_11600 [bacterium]